MTALADQVIPTLVRGNMNRAWFVDGTSAASPADDAKPLRRRSIGLMSFVDGSVVGVTPRGETVTYVFGTGGMALGVVHLFKLRQILATGTTVPVASLYVAEGE